MSFTTSFKNVQTNQNDILTKDYVHNNFATFSFTNTIQSAFKLNAQVFQQIENSNSGVAQMHNSGKVGLEYSKDDLFLSNKIDINRNTAIRIDKILQQDFVKGHTVFGQFKYEQSNLSNENQISPSLGMYKSFDRYAYKAKFNLDKLQGQVKGKAVYDKEGSEKEQYGSGVSASFDFKQAAFNTVKTLLYYTNPTTSMSIQYKLHRNEVKVDENAPSSSSESSQHNKEMYSTFQYSLFQNLNKDTSIAVELKHDARDKKFGMIFGASYSKFENVICKAKIDEKLNVCSSFKIIINPNITLTVSNAIDLNLRTKKDPAASSASFPIGFKLDIQQ